MFSEQMKVIKFFELSNTFEFIISTVNRNEFFFLSYLRYFSSRIKLACSKLRFVYFVEKLHMSNVLWIFNFNLNKQQSLYKFSDWFIMGYFTKFTLFMNNQNRNTWFSLTNLKKNYI